MKKPRVKKTVPQKQVKKTPSRKASTGNPGEKGAGQHGRLLTELGEAIKHIDDEGLLFLLRQAHVLIRNAEVDRFNREAEELERRRGKALPVPSGAAASGVSIEESPDGKAIFLALGNTRKAMNAEEMKRLVRVCYAAETKSDALRQLFTILGRERKDILVDAGIGAPSSPLLEALFRAVRARYGLQDR